MIAFDLRENVCGVKIWVSVDQVNESTTKWHRRGDWVVYQLYGSI